MRKLILIFSVITIMGFTKTESKKGIASYYASKFNGRKTASGERFSNQKFTAASNSFPLQRIVRVVDQQSGNSVIVKINDRMHPSMTKKGRIIDLSTSAMKQLGKLQLRKVIVEEYTGG